MPMKNELLEQFLAGQPQYNVAELQEQLSRFYDNEKIDVSDLKEVLDFLASDHNDKSYIMKIYDITGNFERQAYLLDKERHEGKWSFEHIVVFNILNGPCKLGKRVKLAAVGRSDCGNVVSFAF